MAVNIDIGNASAVKGWLDAQIKAKQFRPCAHLLMKSLRHRISGSAVSSTRVMFIPQCERRSFVWRRHPVPDLEMEREFLAQFSRSLMCGAARKKTLYLDPQRAHRVCRLRRRRRR